MAAVSVVKEGKIAVVTLAKEPVNSMDLGLWKELLSAVESIEADSEVRGMIFRSGLKRGVFTAGLDLKELHGPSTSEARLKDFWTTLSAVLVKVYSSSKVTAAAINGACPAGGCALALCCDLRVISADGAIGLNEVPLGIPVPLYWVSLFASVVGPRQAEKLLQTGELVPSARALQLGLVDFVVDAADNVFPETLQQVGQWLKSPDTGRVLTKKALRNELATNWANGTQQEAALVWQSVSDKRTVAMLSKVMERLAGGPKKAAKL